MNSKPDTSIFRAFRLVLLIHRLVDNLGIMGALLALSSCSTVRVKTQSALVPASGIEAANLLGQVAGAPFSVLANFAESSAGLFHHAKKLEDSGSKQAAAGSYLKAAVDAHALLVAGSEVPGSDAEKALITIHNSAIASFAELWINDANGNDSGPCLLTCGSEKMEVGLSESSKFKRGFFDRVTAAAGIVEKGVDREIRSGYGAPLLAVREPGPQREGEMRFFAPGKGLCMCVTATVDSVLRRKGAEEMTAVKLSLRNPMVEPSVVIGDRQWPVAADFSVPIAMILEGRNETMVGLHGFFNARERAGDSGIYLTEPYDPQRIPVLLIHGLISAPFMWRHMVPDLVVNPEISKRYQFMVFTYPSSYPIVESAALLRDELAALRKTYDPTGTDPLSQNMVVAGHSMGGLLTHTLVADMGDNLWKQFDDTPLDQITADDTEKAEIRRLVSFDPDPAVRRVVYFSTPHRGAKMAEMSVAATLSKMAKLPSNVLHDADAILNPKNHTHLKFNPKGTYTSAQSLKPGAPVVAALDRSPYKPGVAYHSIIGDRGKGDTPNSSDGVVEYWSSHQSGAASELIVPTDHATYKHPRAVEEISRILLLHAGLEAR